MKAKFESSGESFGKVVQPCTVFNPIFDLYDRNGTVKFKVTANCCQCGFCCRKMLCGRVSEVKFGIFGGNNAALSGKPLGLITKTVGGLEELVSDADTFKIEFPNTATPEDKL